MPYLPWPDHHKSIYNKTVRKNHGLRQLLTDEQKITYKSADKYFVAVCDTLTKSTDYPDRLIEVLAENATLQAVVNGKIK
jgi:hypothetical protein